MKINFFESFERCRENGISVSIIPGVMPIYSIKMVESLASLGVASNQNKLRQGFVGCLGG